MLALAKLAAFPILCDLADNGEPEPPAEIQLVPAGKKIKARPEDGRIFRNTNPQRIVEAFDIPIPIDFDHESEWSGGRAAGWVEKIKAKRGGAIWGEVSWTDIGEAAIRARHYRYMSPAMYHDEDGEITKLSSAALVNRPALVLPALSSVQDHTTETDEMDKAILAALHLPETATVSDAVNRIAELATVAAKVAEPPPLEKYVPRGDFAAMQTRAETAEAVIKARETEAAEAAIVAAVDAACGEKKITPGSREQALAMARACGVEAFNAYAATLPAVAEPTDLDTRDPAKDKLGTCGLTSIELEVAARLGQTPQEFAETKATMRGAE